MNRAGMLAAAGAAAPFLSACSDGGTIRNSDIRDAYRTQLLVVGGGPAGVCAAVAAARMGVSVMIVEHGNCLGGMGTSGLVSPFMTSFDGEGEIMIIRGLFEEVVDRMVAIGGAIHPKNVRHTSPYSAWITAGHDHCTPFESEAMKFVMDRMCAEAGVKVLYHADFVKPLMKGDTVCGAVLLTKKGLEAASAAMVIDATGDGDVAYRAGVPTTFGNPETGGVQPSTMFFTICNVDSKALEADVEKHLHEFRKVNGVSYRALHWRVEEAEAAGEWDIARKSVNIYKRVKDDEWAVNCTRIKAVDATDSESLSDGETEGRRQVWEMMNFFHKYVPGCKDARLMSTASTLGIRESRHVQGLRTLNAEDLVNCVVGDDSILVASNSVDVHGKGGSNATEYTTINGRWYGVPFGTLVPVGVKGLLMAGRCLSATSDAAGAVRVMPPVMAMGHAAGVAAALALKGGVMPDDLDVSDIRRKLLAQKAFLG